MARVSPILVILPTSAGKSLLFQFPATLGSIGVTIVIEPLLSLLQDQLSRAKTLGISSAIFNARSPPDSARLVFTTPETFLGLDFRNYINRLRITQQLDRVIIDECHIILNRKESFRKNLGRLGEVVDLKTQLVLLTATLPPRYQASLLRGLFLDPSRTKIYRANTARPNIRYSIQVFRAKTDAFRIIQGELDLLESDQALIYTRTRDQARELSKVLGYSVYYSNRPNKEKILREFLEGKIQVLITTSSLSYGVDRPSIRIIIHLGLPYRLYDYAQETGRAGRDNKRSNAILLLPLDPPTKATSLGHHPTQEDIFEYDIIQRYISNTCRRAILDSYLDGLEEKSCKEEVIKCDFCSLEDSK